MIPMKKHVAIVIAVIAASCADAPPPLELYSVEDMRNKIRIVDTACQNQEARAVSDFKNGKISMGIERIYSFKPYVTSAMIKEALSLHNIMLDTIKKQDMHDSIGRYKLFRPNCYRDKMDEKAGEILGENELMAMIDSLEKSYVRNYPDKIYSGKEYDTKWDRKGGNFHNFRERNTSDFAMDFIYPEGYTPENNHKSSKTTVTFMLLKNGTVKNVSAHAVFMNRSNDMFKAYFEREATVFVEKAIWEPATSSGIPVNAEVTFELSHN